MRKWQANSSYFIAWGDMQLLLTKFSFELSLTSPRIGVLLFLNAVVFLKADLRLGERDSFTRSLTYSIFSSSILTGDLILCFFIGLFCGLFFSLVNSFLMLLNTLVILEGL
jgi:hypothetical protein